MRLSDVLAARIDSDLNGVLEREMAEKGYLNQQDSRNCRERAEKIMGAALERRVYKMLTIAIANHRQDHHDEDHQDEIDQAAKTLTQEDIDLARGPGTGTDAPSVDYSKGWWRRRGRRKSRGSWWNGG